MSKFDEIDLPVQVGELLAGKYRVTRVLGNGAMGVVVAAMHEQLEELVAIKLMLQAAKERPEFVERFNREARAAVKIKNVHVAQVKDVGTLDDGRLYMVMEYLEGADLGRMLEGRGPMPEDVAVDYVLQACEALAEAHALGIVHRDLKPSNLFLTEAPDGAPLVKVLDFGISKVARKSGESEDSRLTSTAAIMGSPLYMSPEQIRSAKDVDARADIWALGVILHELVTGNVPFVGDTHMSILAAISADDPILLREHRPGASAELEAIVARCLSKNPAERYQNVLELARALGPFGPEDAVPSVERAHRSALTGRTSHGGRAVRVSTPAPVDAMADTVHTIAEAAPAKRSQRYFALATILGGLAAVGTVVVLSTRGGSTSSSTGMGAGSESSAVSSAGVALGSSASGSAASGSAASGSAGAATASPSGSALSPVAAQAAASVTVSPSTSALVTASPSGLPDALKPDATAKPKASASASAKASAPVASGGIQLGKEVDTRR